MLAISARILVYIYIQSAWLKRERFVFIFTDPLSQSKMITMQHRKNKRGLQQLSDAQKMEAITKVIKGETKAAVAREFGVPESTLRGWCKKAKLNGHCHSVMSKSLQVTSTMSPVLMTPEVCTRKLKISRVYIGIRI